MGCRIKVKIQGILETKKAVSVSLPQALALIVLAGIPNQGKEML